MTTETSGAEQMDESRIKRRVVADRLASRCPGSWSGCRTHRRGSRQIADYYASVVALAERAARTGDDACGEDGTSFACRSRPPRPQRTCSRRRTPAVASGSRIRSKPDWRRCARGFQTCCHSSAMSSSVRQSGHSPESRLATASAPERPVCIIAAEPSSPSLSTVGCLCRPLPVVDHCASHDSPPLTASSSPCSRLWYRASRARRSPGDIAAGW